MESNVIMRIKLKEKSASFIENRKLHPYFFLGFLNILLSMSTAGCSRLVLIGSKFLM